MAAAQAASCRPLTRALPNPLAAILHCRPCATPRTVASHSEITPRETLVRAETANQALHKRPGHSLNVSAQLRTESRSQSNRIQQNSPELSVPRGTSSLHSSSWPHPHKNIQVGLQQGRGRQASNDIPFTRTAAARCRQQASPNVQADNMSRRHPSSFHKSASFCSRNVAIHLVPRPLSSSAMTSVHWHQRLKCFIHGSTVLQLETRPNRQRIHRWKPAEMGGSRVSRLPLCSSAEAGSSDPPTRHKTLDPPLPLVAPVVRGFGRGSRQMGFPTANMDPGPLGEVLSCLERGVYFGYAQLPGKGPDVYSMVCNIGLRPSFADGEGISIELHLLHEFKDEFYGEEIRALLLGFLRLETRFGSLDALKAQISADIEAAKMALGSDEAKKQVEHHVFAKGL